MKKYLFILSVATLGFAACSNDDVVAENNALGQQPKEIAFAPLNQPTTRAAVQGTTFPTTNTMEVRAYQTQPSTAEFFSKTTYKYQYAGGSSTGAGTTWGGDPARYWPLSPAKLNFFAVSGAGVDADDITIANELASAEVKYKTTGNTSTNTYSATTQSDIMYAFGRGYVEQSGNALHFNSSTTTDQPVNMVFKHALALINFQIKAGNDASTAIKIKKIELNGARYTGTLAITNTNAATEAGAWSAKVDWTPDAVVDNVVVPSIGNTSDPVALTTSYVPVNSATSYPASLMIIPSTQTAETTNYGFTTFTITYTLDNKEYTYTYAPAGYTGETPNLTVVQAGFKYTYQIAMNLHEILINPSVEAWNEQNSADNVVIP